MKIPKWLWWIISVLLLCGILGLIVNNISENQVLKGLGDFALILTLIAVIIYVYFTYMLAKDTWLPSASFLLKPYPNDPYHFAFFVQNHSKVSLNCWCNLNATVYGQSVTLGNFYSGESSFDLQPFGAAHGHFDIKDLLVKAGKTLEEIKKLAPSSNVKEQLYLNIDFWYSPIGSKEITHNPFQPHYFDFNRDIMVMDF